MRRLPFFLFLFLCAGALLASARAGVTTATKTVGGPGDFSSCGTANPPTLCDGVTQASATFQISYDDVTKVLVLVVTNTSPVTAGVPNPLLSQIYFNVPAFAATGLTLLSQTAATDGPDPGFALEFDPDLNDGDNGTTAPGFCAFNAKLDQLTETPGGIANALADTISAPAGTYVVGPVTFTFQVGGPPATGVRGSSFARSFSQIPPGNFRVNVVGKFKEGGFSDASGSMSNKPDCEPGNWIVGTPCLGCPIQFVMCGGAGCFGCLAISAFAGPIVLPTPTGDVTIPIGMPATPVFIATVPPTTCLSASATVPNMPELLGLTFYLANALIDPATGKLSVSEGFSVTIVS
ncbi:MAG TPA: hypothetical protein VFI25_08085 [Planctomycetota bacterium]|jgi:hypothetical protein|nr:hypothetical protein [Planctomycetota bacterium]